MKALGINFPFEETYDGGIIGYTKLDIQSTKANLLAFLTLKKGQRPMDNNLFSPLFDYIMEPWDEISESSLTSELIKKLSKYFPEIEVSKILFEFEEENNLLHMTLYYTIIDLNVNDNISISLVTEI